MTLRQILRAAVVVLAVCTNDVPKAHAQTPGDPQAVRPLFGGAQPPPAGPGRRSLDMIVAISSVRDDDLFGDQGTAPPSRLRIGGQYSDLDASLSLAQTRRRIEIVSRAASSLRHYPDQNSFTASSHSAEAALTAQVGRKTAIRTRFAGAHVSSFTLDFSRRSPLDQGSLSTLGLDNSLLDWTLTSYGGTAELARALGKRSSLGLSYGFQYGERPVIEQRDDERAVTAQFERSIGRDTSVRAVYAFRQGTKRLEGDRRRIWSHDAQMGVGRQWRHSADRRTSVTLTAGPSLLEDSQVGVPRALEEEDDRGDPKKDDRARLARIVGTVALDYELSGRWSTRLSYHRGTGLIIGVSSNAATLDIRGLIGRRVDLAVSAGYSAGDIGLQPLASRYGTSFGSARLQVALARHLAVYGQYFLYRYDFGTAPLPAGEPRRLDRGGVRAGISMWVPLQRG